ncbi:hypothetical protein J4Q44_G00333920, partial [Coregonus suidteri]
MRRLVSVLRLPRGPDLEWPRIRPELTSPVSSRLSSRLIISASTLTGTDSVENWGRAACTVGFERSFLRTLISHDQ